MQLWVLQKSTGGLYLSVGGTQFAASVWSGQSGYFLSVVPPVVSRVTVVVSVTVCARVTVCVTVRVLPFFFWTMTTVTVLPCGFAATEPTVAPTPPPINNAATAEAKALRFIPLLARSPRRPYLWP